jgi:hypothetical protein
MTIVRDRRATQAQQDEGNRSDFAWLLGGAFVAFLVGALAVFGWDHVPQLRRALQVGTPQQDLRDASFARSGPRLGEASMAPMLRLCVPQKLLDGKGGADVNPPAIYKALHRATAVSEARVVFDQNDVNEGERIAASIWSEVANCVYRQNGPAFCDPHNRAFAIEAVNAFIRTYRPELAKSMSQDPEAGSRGGEILRLLDNRKERVLDMLQARLREGRLIAADFVSAAPAEITALLRDVKPTRNLCFEEKRY